MIGGTAECVLLGKSIIDSIRPCVPENCSVSRFIRQISHAWLARHAGQVPAVEYERDRWQNGVHFARLHAGLLARLAPHLPNIHGNTLSRKIDTLARAYLSAR